MSRKKQVSKRNRLYPKKKPRTAQQTIPYTQIYKGGICKVREGYYTKTISYEDINYSVASTDAQNAILDGYGSFLNYFDSTLPCQFTFTNRKAREHRYKVNIPPQDDHQHDAGLNSGQQRNASSLPAAQPVAVVSKLHKEYTAMLQRQIVRSNNGILRARYTTFGVHADNLPTARLRLERVEADVIGNYKKLGSAARALNGKERLELLHSQLHLGQRVAADNGTNGKGLAPAVCDKFSFSWADIAKTGQSTKDYIAPTSFEFKPRLFRTGKTYGAVSYLQIMASEMSDKLLRELLEMDAEMTVTLHVQAVDQAEAVKRIKRKVSDIDKMKIDAVRPDRALCEVV